MTIETVLFIFLVWLPLAIALYGVADGGNWRNFASGSKRIVFVALTLPVVWINFLQFLFKEYGAKIPFASKVHDWFNFG